MMDQQLLLNLVDQYSQLMTNVVNYHLLRRRQEGRRQRRLELVDQLLSLATCLPRRNSPRIPRLLSYRNVEFWNNFNSMDAKEFVSNFRLNRTAFDYVVGKLEPLLQRETTSFGVPMSVQKIVAIALATLASNSEYHRIGCIFGVGKTSVWRAFKEFIDAADIILTPIHMRIPTSSEFRNISQRFEQKWGWPMAVGAVDGCHVPIYAPHEQSSEYYNYKSTYSSLCIAICDADYKVYYLKSGLPGRCNDSGAFRETSFFQKASSGQLFPTDTRDICGTAVPFHILGDSAFPLLSWIMKPFSSISQTENELVFNKKHSVTRRPIECCFGRCKGRFRRILKRLNADIEDIHKIVKVAFVLNNICEDFVSDFDPNWEIQREDEDQPPNNATTIEQNSYGSDIRNGLKEYFTN